MGESKERKEQRAKLERVGREMAEILFAEHGHALRQAGDRYKIEVVRRLGGGPYDTRFVICSSKDDLGDQEIVKNSPAIAISLTACRKRMHELLNPLH